MREAFYILSYSLSYIPFSLFNNFPQSILQNIPDIIEWSVVMDQATVGWAMQDGQDMTIAGQIVQTIADSRARRSYPASGRAMLHRNSCATDVMLSSNDWLTIA